MVCWSSHVNLNILTEGFTTEVLGVRKFAFCVIFFLNLLKVIFKFSDYSLSFGGRLPGWRLGKLFDHFSFQLKSVSCLFFKLK